MDTHAVSLEELSEIENELLGRRGVHDAMIVSRERAKQAAEEYRKQLKAGEWSREHYRAMEAAVNLHRGDVMGFANDEGFLKSYDRYRLIIFRAVESYRRLEELREKEPERFQRALETMRMTVSTFDKMSDKMNLLDMQGRYMDVRSGIVANPYYVSMENGQFDKIKRMGAEELQKEIGLNSEGADAENRKSLLESVIILRKMEGYGITGKAEGTRRKAVSYEKNPSKKNGLYASINSRYHDVGIQKNAAAIRNFGDYIKGHKWKAGSSDSAYKYGNLAGEYTELANISTNVANGKYRAVKIGGKYRNKTGTFTAGAHLTGGTVKGSADVGAVFTGGRLWESKIYAAASATAYGMRGVAKASAGYRTDWAGADTKAEGNAGYVTAKGTAGAGLIRYTDDRGEIKEGFGVSAGITAKAAAVEGSIGGGITIFGVRFGGRVTANAGSAGFSAKLSATANHISFGFGAALGLGSGFEVSIDWTGLKNKFANWRNRRKQRAKLRELRAEEKSRKRSEAGVKKGMNL